jgi:hypothetical protein
MKYRSFRYKGRAYRLAAILQGQNSKHTCMAGSYRVTMEERLAKMPAGKLDRLLPERWLHIATVQIAGNYDMGAKY